MTTAAARRTLLAVLEQMPDEAFSWLVLSMRPAAMMLGAGAQIWPDGIGGFRADSRAAIGAARDAALAYLDALQQT